MKTIANIMTLCLCMLLVTSCAGDDTYKLAKRMREYNRTPLLAALNGNRNNIEIIYWLIDQGANINAVDYDNCSVFNYIRYWDDNDDTQELINYLKDNCDMQYLKEKTENNPLCSWDEMWDEDNEFVFYNR